MIIDGRKVIRAVCIVHVDDLQFAWIIEVVVPLLERLQKKVKLQVEGPFLTPQEREAGYSLQHVRFLKRKFTYEDHELRISIDPKYVKKLTEVLQLDKKQSRKPKQTPCASSSSEPDNSAALAPAEAATHRSAVGVLLYVAHDRPDIQVSVRSLSCRMKEPTEKKFKELQHLALSMKGTADYVAVFKKTKKGQSVLSTSNLSSSQGGVPEEEEQQHEGERLLEVFSDSDWAGDKKSRRSVSCACMFLDGNYFFSYSRTQKSIALSSAEAEYLSLTGAASEALNIHIALRFLTASPVVLKAFTDSSACRGICARQGVGRIKHLAVRLLRLQQAIRAGRLTVHSVPTQQNPADIGTKPLTAKRIQLLLYILNFRNDDQRIGEEEYRQYSATAVIRRLEKSFSKKGFFTAAVFAALAQGSEGMKQTLSKQETCKGAAAAMAETATMQQAACSITLDSQASMQLTSDEFSAFPGNMSTCEACTFVTATSVAKSESIASCTIHVQDRQQEQFYMFQEVVTFVFKKFISSKLLFSALGAIVGRMERYEVYAAILLILAVYLYGKFGDEFEIRKKKAAVAGEVFPKVKETVEEEEEEEESEEETAVEDKQAKKEATAKQSSGEVKGKKSEEPGKEKKKQKTEKTTSTSTASSSQKVPEPEEEVVRLQALVEEKEEAINDLADDLVKVRALVAEKRKS